VEIINLVDEKGEDVCVVSRACSVQNAWRQSLCGKPNLVAATVNQLQTE
jgi:hypothetical protein